jgi:hypothetical protein
MTIVPRDAYRFTDTLSTYIEFGQLNHNQNYESPAGFFAILAVYTVLLPEYYTTATFSIGFKRLCHHSAGQQLRPFYSPSVKVLVLQQVKQMLPYHN